MIPAHLVHPARGTDPCLQAIARACIVAWRTRCTARGLTARNRGGHTVTGVSGVIFALGGYAGGVSLYALDGDLLCLATSLPALPCAAPLGASTSAGFFTSLVTAVTSRHIKRPEPGVYIRGIW